ncbi:hypothetical protein BS47DRAFT_1426480 [Hydnum rufescens UP504]|uniref:Uncharacterized protein n=1 Tax=Hydnum rufescens UP504 TaxID=1448309 RepID=A0A9P6E2Q1_9AGAM|nr:hypothetical protein BS47DRAFT_1426480 [Hydnum rufescens UP504]
MYTFIGDYTGKAFGYKTFGTVYGLAELPRGRFRSRSSTYRCFHQDHASWELYHCEHHWNSTWSHIQCGSDVEDISYTHRDGSHCNAIGGNFSPALQ